MRSRRDSGMLSAVSPRIPVRVGAIALLLVLSALQVACITRTTRTKVWSSEGTQVILRGKVRGTKPVDQGFGHPATISPVRMAHILSRIDLRNKEDGKRVPAIPLATLFIIGEGLSAGLAEADPSQEIVIQSIEHKRKWGVFDHKFLTSLLAYMKDDLLYIHVSRSDWKIPARKEFRDQIPETHAGKHVLDFRLVIDSGMALVDEQGVAVNWRDPVFARPTRTRVTRSGRVVRRQVLMEDLSDDPELSGLPTTLTPEQLRALADLEEERRAGGLSEAQYTARRGKIMAGEID